MQNTDYNYVANLPFAFETLSLEILWVVHDNVCHRPESVSSQKRIRVRVLRRIPQLDLCYRNIFERNFFKLKNDIPQRHL